MSPESAQLEDTKNNTNPAQHINSTTCPSQLLKEEFCALNQAVSKSNGPAPLLSLATLLLSPTTAHSHPGELAHLFNAALSEPTATLPGLCALAHVFSSSRLVSRSIPRAVALWRRCADTNQCLLGSFLLAQELEDGTNIPQDIPEAVRLYQYVISNSSSHLTTPTLRLARLLELGAEGMASDPKRAILLYESAIRQAHSIEAMECLADLYLDGSGEIPEQPLLAVGLYERAIREACSTRAMNSLAVLLETGADGVPRNAQRAVALFEMAIAAGNDEAMANLAFLLDRGADGVERDIKRAAALYERAVESGNRFAMRNLAHMIVNGEGDVEQDLYRAMLLYEEVLQHGRYEGARVKVNLAWLLSCHQDILPQDTVRAAALYEDVIQDEVNACAMYNLAGLLAEGRGELRRDVGKAIDLYQRAIDEDDAFSMHNLGLLITSDTEGVEKDMERGIELLERAVEEGLREAEFDLALILTGGDSASAIGDGSPVDMDRGIALYEELIEDMDHIGAIINLSELYGEGRFGVCRDVKKAIQLSERAISLAFENNVERLAELGIHGDPETALREDCESVEMREHAIAQRWHLVAMCNLAELLLAEDVSNLERSVVLIEKALSDARASKALQVLSFKNLLSGMWRAVRNGRDRSACEKVANVFNSIVGRIGNTQAMCLLADMLIDGSHGVSQDVKKSISLYQRAIFNKDTRAMLSLGEVLLNGGPCIPVDMHGAVKLFSQILEQDPLCDEAHEAIVNLALIYTENRQDT